MKKRKIIIAFLTMILSTIIMNAQEKYTLSGTVTDEVTGETALGANIIIPDFNTGVVTNEYGFYSITLPSGTHKVVISYLGYQTIEQQVTLNKNTKLNFTLTEETSQLDAVIIEKNIEKNSIRKPQMSVNTLTAKSLKKIPAVLGEPDVIKSILLLPGVSNAGEGASGFNVRGGGADQNLILLDEAIIFNTSHLFGLFSVFNTDAIKDLKLYKGGIPARYGGRLSSVLDIYQREGNKKEFKMNGGIGLISSKLLLEGPIKKDKGSFLLAGRTSYAHLFLQAAGEENTASFYDLNTKLSYNIDENNSIYASGYFGRDNFEFGDSFINTYGNSVANLRWNHLFSNKLFSNLSLIYSDYYYGLELDVRGFEWESHIVNFNLKYDFKHYVSNKLTLDYGINNIYYHFSPGEIRPNSADSGINAEVFTNKYANEFAVYIDAEHKISDKLSLRYGLRWSHFNRLGQDEFNVYENNNPVIYNEDFQIYEGANPTGVESSDRSESLADFNNFEPRLALSYLLNDRTSLKLSYNRMSQYLHLLSNTNSPTPLDVWTPSGPYIEPQTLDQYALGFYKDFKDGKYSLELEVFYKNIQNRIDYIDGADLIANEEIEQVILNGEARAYGLEVLFRKNQGKLKGWIAYTLSKSEQRTPGRTSSEPGINNGKWYNSLWDRPHDFSVNASYELNNKWSFNSNFIYQTGIPTNLPIGQVEQLGITVPIYGGRNESRLTDYHRLDVSVTLTPRNNKGRRWQSEWVFGFYNIYNRRNAASYSFEENRETGQNEAIRTSIFGAVPAISYNFKF
ncbi:TonB-dependent receptor [Kordia jejudonensis]|uniref:TonB-dependent receptor n=1 Tax=Kordia jejudonensis TaxID=1348245 RepID=UPI000629AA72|nr:TonB-dependent receptor [Kordia jejudonensis]